MDRLAREVGRDAGQVSKWEKGTERPQFDALWAVDALRGPLVIALAELAHEHVEVMTEIRIRRTA